MNKIQQYHQRASVAVCADIIAAASAYDSEAMQAAWRTVQNIANAMGKQYVAIPLDDSVPLDCLSNGHSGPESDESGGGGHKVESAAPKPTLPSGGIAADPVAALDGLL